jgi:hypothetical protein
MDKVRYQYFDFHSECSRMRWDRISILLDQMDEDLNKQGYAHAALYIRVRLCPRSYFHLDGARGSPVRMQTGVIRTNCMDNLDRTNVSQAAFARWHLDRQLRAVGVMNPGDSVALHADLDSIFRISTCALQAAPHTC